MATTYEKTWAFDMNRAITPASALDLTRRTMWHIAAALTGNLGGLASGLWTLYASSDSSTAGTDSTDRWKLLSAAYDGTKIVRGATTSVHSWIVLASPSMAGVVWYMVLSFNTAADTSIRITFHKVAPTGGSTTATPTSASTSMWCPHANGAATDYIVNAGATDNSRFSVGLTSAGDFYYLQNKQGANLANFCVIFSTISNSKTNDAYKVWASVSYHATSLNQVVSNFGNFTYGSTAGNTYGQKADGLGTIVFNPLMLPAITSNTAPVLFTHTAADVIDSTFADFPLWITTGSVGGTAPTSIRGRLADFACTPYATAALAEGSGSPASGAIDSAKTGHMWFPASAAFNFA